MGFETLKQLKDRHVPAGSFRRNVLTMFSGTAAAQGVMLLAAPFLTRLYLPESFGTLDAFMALVSLAAIAAAGRYDIAIILPEKDRDGAALVWLAGALALASAGACLALAFLLGPQARALLAGGSLEPASRWLYAIGPAVAAVAVYQLLNYWSVRLKRFADVSLGKVIQSCAFVALAVCAGAFRGGPAGLIAAQIAAPLLAALFLLSRPYSVLGLRGWASAGQLRAQAVRYRRFPLFSLPADFINTAATQLPYLLVASLFGPAALGLFTLPNRVLGAPISLLATSVLDVFKQRASKDYAEQGNCLAIYRKTFKALALLGLVPFLLAFALAPRLFPLIFGANWAEAGVYARLLSVMFYCRFVASPLSYVIYIAEKQSYDLVWQAVLLAVTCGSILAGAAEGNVKTAVLLFSVSYSVMYLVYLWMSYSFARGDGAGAPPAHCDRPDVEHQNGTML